MISTEELNALVEDGKIKEVISKKESKMKKALEDISQYISYRCKEPKMRYAWLDMTAKSALKND